MNKGELQALVPATKAQFLEAFPQAKEVITNTEVFIILNGNRAKKRAEVFAYCGAREKEDGALEGEAVIGSRHKAVIIYASVIKNPRRFKHVLWHEMGHIYSQTVNQELFAEAERDMLEDNDTLVRNGMCIWTEFIAEIIAYIVEDSPPVVSVWQSVALMQHLMDEAVNTGHLAPYPLAFFMAMLYEDPNIVTWSERNGNTVPGLNHCDDDALPLIKRLTDILGKQRHEEAFVSISRETLEQIGECVNDLWDFCEVRMFSRALQQRKDRVTD